MENLKSMSNLTTEVIDALNQRDEKINLLERLVKNKERQVSTYRSMLFVVREYLLNVGDKDIAKEIYNILEAK